MPLNEHYKCYSIKNLKNLVLYFLKCEKSLKLFLFKLVVLYLLSCYNYQFIL